MLSLAENEQVDLFFAQADKSHDRLLILEYDGVIAPCRPGSSVAVPHPAIPHLLRRIMSCKTRLIVIGDDPGDVENLLGMNPLPEVCKRSDLSGLRTQFHGDLLAYVSNGRKGRMDAENPSTQAPIIHIHLPMPEDVVHFLERWISVFRC
jgi:hypothetical protein